MSNNSSSSWANLVPGILSFIHSHCFKSSNYSRSWADLPPEILNSIQQRLLLQDYSNFRATCRSWKLAAQFDHVACDNDNNAVRLPFLLQFCRSRGNDSLGCCKAYSAASGKSYYLRIPIAFLDAKIYCSIDGWLLIGRGQQVFFYHPSTERFIDLPIPAKKSRVPFNWMSFSASPTSPECMVVGIRYSRSKRTAKFSFIQPGQCSWEHYYNVSNSMRLVNDRPRKLNTIRRLRNVIKGRPKVSLNMQKIPCIGKFLWSNYDSAPVFYKGAFYCLAQNGRLGVLNPKEKKEAKMWRLLDTTSWSRVFMSDGHNQAYLLECKGDLISIVVAPMGKSVTILRFYKKAWQIVHNLHDQMIFLSHPGCVVVAAAVCGQEEEEKEELKNTIHFPNLCGSHHMYYSTSSGQFHSFEGGDQYTSSDDLYETSLSMTHTWISPAAYVRNSSFMLPPSSSERIRTTTMQDVPVACPYFVSMNDELGEQALVNLDSTVNHSQHSRTAELAAMIGSNKVYNTANSRGVLVLIDDEAGRCGLLDPTSMVTTWLPPWGTSFTTKVVVHLSPSSNSKSKRVVVFGTRHVDDEESGDEAFMMIWRHGDEKWRSLYVGSTYNGIKPSFGVVVHDGRIYGLYPSLYLAEIESYGRSMKPIAEVMFPKFEVAGSRGYQLKLLESSGELLLFIKHVRSGCSVTWIDKTIVLDIHVFKMDWKRKRWEIMQDLGDRAFFWSDWVCYSCCASKSGFQRNSIYFIERIKSNLAVFNYEDRTISVSQLPFFNRLIEPGFFMW